MKTTSVKFRLFGVACFLFVVWLYSAREGAVNQNQVVVPAQAQSSKLLITDGSERIETCFVPGQPCDIKIAVAIAGATKSVDIQAYYLTNKKIIAALDTLEASSVKIRIILDKAGHEAVNQVYGNIWIDSSKAIAHNKVIIIDGKQVITGSYNFTESAQNRNVENVVFINDPKIADEFTTNFNDRLEKSKRVK